jgi:hypothetical protein
MEYIGNIPEDLRTWADENAFAIRSVKAESHDGTVWYHIDLRAGYRVGNYHNIRSYDVPWITVQSVENCFCSECAGATRDKKRLQIRNICRRFAALVGDDRYKDVLRELNYDMLTMTLDLQFADAHIPLDFDVLLEFTNSDFLHDVLGIRRHMQRDAEQADYKKLTSGFCPRCAKAPESPSYVVLAIYTTKSLEEAREQREALSEAFGNRGVVCVVTRNDFDLTAVWDKFISDTPQTVEEMLNDGASD